MRNGCFRRDDSRLRGLRRVGTRTPVTDVAKAQSNAVGCAARVDSAVSYPQIVANFTSNVYVLLRVQSSVMAL